MYFLKLFKEFLVISFRRYRIYKKYNVHCPFTSIIAGDVKIGKSFGLSPECQILCQDPQNGSQLSIGNNVKLNYGVMINADNGGKIKIGDNVLIGPKVTIRAADHMYDRLEIPIIKQGHVSGVISIGDNVWIGAHVVVLKNVSIGTGAIIAAGCVVTKDVPPNTIFAGVPGKVIRER